jgi:sugar lactone lactonase YvrE
MMPTSGFLFTALARSKTLRTRAISLLFAGLFVVLTMATRGAHGQIAIPSTGEINTVAGDGTAGYVSSQDGNLAVNAELNGPAGVAVDVHGNIYIADTNNNRIRMISAQTGDITTVAGTGTAGYVEAQDGGPALSAELNGPTGVALDVNGNIYIADASNNRIRMVAAKTGDISTVAGNGTQCSNPTVSPACGDGGSPTSAELNDPFGVAVDASGNIYIADTDDLRVRKVTFPLNATPFISTVAGTGSGGYNGDKQPATNATIDHPTGVAVDANGNIYISDKFNQRIRAVFSGGTVINVSSPVGGDIYTVAGDPSGCSAFCGSGGGNFSGNNGPATSAELHYPYGIAVDPIGNIYFADLFNNCARMVAASTFNTYTAGDIYDLAGTCPNAGFTGDGGVATSAELSFPWGVALDLSGNVYIGDSANNRVRVVGSRFVNNTFTPLYKVLSILYAPPGNGSSQGYGSSTTNGTTTTIGSSFTSGSQISYSAGAPSILQTSQTIGTSTTSSNTDAFAQTYNNAITLTSSVNKSTLWNPNKLDNLNPNLDTFMIWLNPLITVLSTPATPPVPLFYSVSSSITTINDQTGPNADVIAVPAIAMEAAPLGITSLNPSGLADVTTIPIGDLVPQAHGTSPNVVYLPGLGAICKNNGPYIAQLENPSSNSCTQANQCGCTPADFAGILQLDPLLNYNPNTFTASLYPPTENPMALDNLPLPGSTTPGSGESACADQSTLASSKPNCRFVFASTNSLPLSNATSAAQTVMETETTLVTLGGSTSNTVQLGSQSGDFKDTTTWTWTDSESMGTSNGEGNSMSILLTTTSGCNESVDIFEDTLYHTFAFSLPTDNSDMGCQPSGFSVTVLPTNIANQNNLSLGHSLEYTVTVSALNGFTGPVALTISGLPAGVTAQFSPSSTITTSGTATLTLTAAYSETTFVGNSTITLTGTNSGVTQSMAFSLVTRPLQYNGSCSVQ